MPHYKLFFGEHDDEIEFQSFDNSTAIEEANQFLEDITQNDDKRPRRYKLRPIKIRLVSFEEIFQR